MFDFDALDEAEEAIKSKEDLEDTRPWETVVTWSVDHSSPTSGDTEEARQSASSSDTDSDDEVSEIWPGDVVRGSDTEDEEEESRDDGVLDSLEPPRGFEAAPEDAPEALDVRAWEVVISRAVVRAQPSLSAPVVGLCSQRELVFEDHDPSHPDWVRLVSRRGYILKDGRKRDPSLGMLLQPFVPLEVPDDSKLRVLVKLQEAWEGARTTFLRPPLIRRLRKAYDDAICSAQMSGGFDMEAFSDTFDREAENIAKSDGAVAAKTSARTTGAVRTLANAAANASLVGGMGSGFRRFWDYTAPLLRDAQSPIPMSFVLDILENMRCRHLPNVVDVATVLSKAVAICEKQKSLVRLQVPPTGTLHVVGDLHGQYWDLLYILDTFGEPTRKNQYLFNGDFVDRGQFSVEVAIALLALKAAAPDCVHLNRGNHEAIRMNMIYGFTAEAKHKYNEDVFGLFCQAFQSLPLATVANESIFIVHGGLFSQDNVQLRMIEDLCRLREPDEKADELMIDLLWSDPMEKRGRERSPRGGGILFGPDVTRRFLEDNDLECVIRSHEMKQEGYEWHHDRQCLTVFSAPNYCGLCGNSGAICDLTVRSGCRRLTRSDMKVRTFGASPHPDERGAIPGLGFF